MSGTRYDDAKFSANEEPDVEAHLGTRYDDQKLSVSDEPDADDEVEAHLKVSRPKHS
jgi:hypothetical protein